MNVFEIITQEIALLLLTRQPANEKYLQPSKILVTCIQNGSSYNTNNGKS